MMNGLLRRRGSTTAGLPLAAPDVNAAQRSAASQPSQPPQLPYRLWFARRAYFADLVLLSLDFVLACFIYWTTILYNASCAAGGPSDAGGDVGSGVVGGGGPAAAVLLQALHPPLDPAARRVDAVLTGFPCNARYSQQLLYTLRTGAAIDPRVRLRLGDYPTAALLLTQPLTLALALAAPVLYERFRSGLAIANVVLPELCLLVSAAWTPAAGLLRVLSTQFLIGERRRIGRMFLVWRSVVVYRAYGPAGSDLYGAAASGSAAAAFAAPAEGTPLGALPLLVLPDASAWEVCNLYDGILGADAVRALKRTLRPLAMPSTGGGGTSPPGQPPPPEPYPADALAASVTDVLTSNVSAFAWDLGEVMLLLSLLGSSGAAASTAAADDATGTEVAASVAAGVLHFLSDQGLAACLSDARRALRNAGLLPDEAQQQWQPPREPDAAPALSISHDEGDGCCSRERLGPSGAEAYPREASPQPPSSAQAPSQHDSALMHPAGTPQPHPRPHPQPHVQPPPPSHRPRHPHPPHRAEPADLAWSPRSALLGFSPALLEARFQSFKAARCARLDYLGLVLWPLCSAAALLNTCREGEVADGRGSGFGGGGFGSSSGDKRHDPRLDGGRSSAFVWRLRVLLRVLHLAAVAAPLTLALLTSLRSRRRNSLLLLYGVLDVAIAAAIAVPGPWGSPLMPLHDPWVGPHSRLSPLWLLRCLVGPCLSQLSPYLELWVVLAGLLPVFFVSLRSFGGWRAPAVAVAAGYALGRMALSFATDALARRRFLRPRAAGGGGGGRAPESPAVGTATMVAAAATAAAASTPALPTALTEKPAAGAAGTVAAE
ncbi:hypothetical protein GPECTOR_9g500 [Gonium pectorale]|uniref:Uncharacterized protein n=1 Tax=Gonium pectorale TaxID=33097 RepID=A0A150GRF9_GONPE|nr:hypothetical protein GPECTOR_9g500 [Gonium pectorale]|eukprot:KXZ52456.1 hypothetical protein GPECTOR_9g500 [Gonium pectorale]